MALSSMQDKERKDAKFFTEIRAGLTTFFTMAYVIAVNVSPCITSLMVSANPRSHPLSLKQAALVFAQVL
jgi:xanthine/uracil/vitamin C permease (AzgA family)